MRHVTEKLANYRKSTDEELQKELDGLRKNLFEIRTKKITDVLEKSSVIRDAKRDIARVLTIVSARRQAKVGHLGNEF